MKKVVVSLLAAVLTLLCVPMGTVFADTENATLRVYNWGEYISNGEDDSLDVIAEFERLNPGVKVDYQTYATNEEMYAKIASGSADYDIIIPSDYMVGKLIAEGRLAKLNYDNIPNASKIDPEFRKLEFDPTDEYSVPYTWGAVGIIYNTKKVNKPVDSWDALWDPDYKGNILMFDNPRDSFGIALKKLGYSMNATDRAQLDEAAELLKEQKQYLQAYVMDQIFAKMTGGEAAVAPYYAGDAITMIDDNPDLAFVYPKEGVNRFVDSVVVPATSKQKELAERFINFLLEDEIAAANISYIGYSSPMSSVKELLDDDLKNSPIAYPDTSVLTKSDIFVTLDDDTNNYMQEAWTDILSSGDSGSTGPIMIVLVVVVVAVIAFLLYRKKKSHR